MKRKGCCWAKAAGINAAGSERAGAGRLRGLWFCASLHSVFPRGSVRTCPSVGRRTPIWSRTDDAVVRAQGAAAFCWRRRNRARSVSPGWHRLECGAGLTPWRRSPVETAGKERQDIAGSSSATGSKRRPAARYRAGALRQSDARTKTTGPSTPSWASLRTPGGPCSPASRINARFPRRSAWACGLLVKLIGLSRKVPEGFRDRHCCAARAACQRLREREAPPIPSAPLGRPGNASRQESVPRILHWAPRRLSSLAEPNAQASPSLTGKQPTFFWVTT